MATTEQDYYELLGVARDASHAEIKRAFRRLARELHPDVSDDPDAGLRFRSIAEAVENVSGLDGKTAVVTGGAQGIGRAIALRLAEEMGVPLVRSTDLFVDLVFAGQGTIRLPDGDDERAIAEEAARRRVAIEVMADYRSGTAGAPTLLLGYGQIAEPSIRPGIGKVRILSGRPFKSVIVWRRFKLSWSGR